MSLPLLLAFEIPGVLVPFPPEPPPTAFKLGFPVPAAPLPAALFEFGDPPPTKPAGGHLQRIRPALRRQRRHCPSLPRPLRPQLRHPPPPHPPPTQIQRPWRLSPP